MDRMRTLDYQASRSYRQKKILFPSGSLSHWERARVRAVGINELGDLNGAGEVCQDAIAQVDIKDSSNITNQ